MSSDKLPTSGGLKKEEKVYPVPKDIKLPEGYGDTEAYLLPRDPEWMFLYWEVTETSIASLKRQFGEDIMFRTKSVVRIHDVTGVNGFDGQNSESYFDVPIVLEAKNWYLNVPKPGRAYICDIGLIDTDGRFILLARSNMVGLPAGCVSDKTDEHWMSVNPDFQKLLKLSGIEYLGRGSGDIARVLAQRWEMIKSVSSRGASWGAHPGTMTGKKDFWLVADCELVLYGATEPDAKVTVAGRTVKLNPDGTFSLRFAFPDGVLDLPVHADNADGDLHRQITITAERKTQTDE
ncbi:MAG: DUF4912 domain-containing protein [Elusimicrobiaceae bacterium]|nr:DUF4912 domain-containing protein [Elusimicrobiaceae bacterium]